MRQHRTTDVVQRTSLCRVCALQPLPCKESACDCLSVAAWEGRGGEGGRKVLRMQTDPEQGVDDKHALESHVDLQRLLHRDKLIIAVRWTHLISHKPHALFKLCLVAHHC